MGFLGGVTKQSAGRGFLGCITKRATGSDCGANAQGGLGFQPGNTSASDNKGQSGGIQEPPARSVSRDQTYDESGVSIDGRRLTGPNGKSIEISEEAHYLSMFHESMNGFADYRKSGKEVRGEASARKWDVGAFMDDRYIASGLERVPDDIQGMPEEDFEALAGRISDTHMHELITTYVQERDGEIESSGREWYGKGYTDFLGDLSEHLGDPNLASLDTVEGGMFTMILAATSNGQTVQSNLNHAIEWYQSWEESGRTSIMNGKKFLTGGKSHVNINQDLEMVDTIAQRLGGPEELLKLANRMTTIKELREHGIDEIGDVAGDMNMEVPGSYVLGPKLGRFYANLTGNEKELTIDMWHGRLLRQSLGTVAYKGDKVIKQTERILSVMDSNPELFHEEPKPIDLEGVKFSRNEEKHAKEMAAFPKESDSQLHGFTMDELRQSADEIKQRGEPRIDDTLVEWARRSSREYANLDFGSHGKGLSHIKNEKRLAAKTFSDSMTATNDTVNVGLRSLATRAAEKTVEKLHSIGYTGETIASAQAALWTNIKKQWRDMGARNADKATYQASLDLIKARARRKR